MTEHNAIVFDLKCDTSRTQNSLKANRDGVIKRNTECITKI